MKTLLFVACWAIAITGVVLGAVSLGLLAGPPAVLGFLSLVFITTAISGLVALNSFTEEVTDAEVP